MASLPEQVRSAGPRGLLRINRGFYAGPPDQPRVRRATDILGLVASLLALAGIVAAQPPGSLERSFLRFLRAFPTWLGPVWASLIGLLIAWVVVLVVVPLFSGRPRIVVEALLAVVLAGLLAMLAARVATGDWPGGQAISGLSTRLHFPGIRLAMAAALIFVVNAHLTRPLASTGRRILALGAAGALLQGSTTVGGTAAALLVGVAAGAAVRLALGTSAGLPTIADVAGALADLGVRAADFQVPERQTAGVFLVHAREPGGSALAIKVYGRDAYDNQRLEKLWRTIWYRDGGSSVSGLNRSQGAEREALEGGAALLARSRPALAVSVYHRPGDLWELPLHLNALSLGYRFFLRTHGDVDHGQRARLEELVVGARQTQDLGDDHRRVVVRELAHQVGRTARGEAVDHLVDDRDHHVLVPVLERPLAERLRHEVPQPPVLRLVHADERVRAHHHAHEFSDRARGERHVVAHRRRHQLVREDLVRPVLHERDRLLAALVPELGVRIADVARHPAELPHRIERHHLRN